MCYAIRTASKEDAAVLSEILAASWKTAYVGIVPQAYLDDLKTDYWVPKFSRDIEAKKLSALLISLDGVPAGCITFGSSRSEKLPEWGEIVSLYVHPRYFKRGCGKKLLQSAKEALRASGYKNVFLWAFQENRQARAFYEKNGFTASGETCLFEIMGKKLVESQYTSSLSE